MWVDPLLFYFPKYSFGRNKITIMRKTFFGLFFLISLITSCRKIDTESKILPNKESNSNENLSYREGPIVLGEQKQNPYTIENMQAAVNSLAERGVTSLHNINIRPTYLYVKFAPQNHYQYEELGRDTTLQLFDYPLDYEITLSGNSYHDPTLPDSSITYQYTSVPYNYDFNDTISYEILSELYIPEEDGSLVGSTEDNLEFVEKLLDQAYIQTGNYEDTIKAQQRFEPSGSIKVFDTRVNDYIGVEGVRIVARRWFLWRRARTDYYGDFIMTKNYKRPVNYSAWFNDNKFEVRRQFIGTVVWINGPKKEGAWDHLIVDGFDRFVAHLFRGGWKYFNGFNGGLDRPSVLKLFIIAKDEHDPNGVLGRASLTWPEVTIFRYLGKNEVSSDDYFSCTVHEISHISLRKKIGYQAFHDLLPVANESFATAIQLHITAHEYQPRTNWMYGTPYYSSIFGGGYEPLRPIPYAFQYWNASISGDYTSLFINLVDNYNELNQQFILKPSGSIYDIVSGYTLSGIEDNIIEYCSDWTTMKAALKANKPTGVQDYEIENLVNQYQ